MLFRSIALWGATGVLARNFRPWAIIATHAGVAVCLAATYGAAWRVAVICAGQSRRRMVFRAVATTLLFVLSVLILEIPACLGWLDYSHIWNHLTGDWSGPASSFMSDPDLMYRHLPNTTWSGQPRSDMAVYWNLPVRSPVPLTFTTDSRGFRNCRELDRADIVLLGDSYIEGSYVSDGETCAAILGKSVGCEVANLAQAGFGTLQELEVLERYAIPMQPRLIAWFFFEGNDLYNDQSFADWQSQPHDHSPGKPGQWDWTWDGFLDRSFTKTAFLAIRRLLHPLVPNTVDTSGLFRDEDGQEYELLFYSYGALEFGDYERDLFEKSKAGFRRGHDLCRQNGIKLVVFYIPMKFRVYGDLCEFPKGSLCREWKPWRLVDHFRAFCEAESIEFEDLTIPMRKAAAKGNLLYAPPDSHWNQQGHIFVAELLKKCWDQLKAPPSKTQPTRE